MARRDDHDAETLCDEELARRARAGSPAAFASLVHRFQHRLYALLLQRVRSAADAEDLVQETFLRAYERLGQYRDGYKFSGWLFTIAIRLAATHHRRARRGEPRGELPDVADPADSPAQQLAAREQSDTLWAVARQVLDEQQFSALWLFYVEEMPIQQIAQVLGRSRVAVRVGLFRSRQRLARALQGENPAGSREGPDRLPPSENIDLKLYAVKG